MSRRLILVLTLAFVIGFTAAAFAEVQNVKVSGDLTFYGLTRKLYLEGTDSNKEQAIAAITRVKVDADLTDNVMTTVRLLNERYWAAEATGDAVDGDSQIDLSDAYVTLKEFLYSPLTLVVGLQPLRYGNAMIIGDPDTNNAVATASAFSGTGDDADLSARKTFQAVRAILNYDPLVVDLVTAKMTENTKTLQDDRDLYGINAAYKLNDKTSLEGYYWLRYQARELATLTTHKPDRIDVLGARIATKLTDDVTYQLEAAYQMGKANAGLGVTATGTNPGANPDEVAARKALAIETGITMNMPNKKWTPSVSALYAYFSGNRGDKDEYTRWDPMCEDQSFGNIANAQFAQSNAHIAGLVGSIKPTNDVTVVGEYYAFWWDKQYANGEVLVTARGDSVTMKDNKFAGQELDLKAIYDYTEDVQISLLGGVFFPGGSFAQTSDHDAYEVVGSMKVTF